MTDKKKQGDDYVKGLVGDSIDGMMGKKKPKAKKPSTYQTEPMRSDYGSSGRGYGGGGWASRGFYGGGAATPRRYGDNWGGRGYERGLDDWGDANRPSAPIVARPTGASQRMARAAQKALDASEFAGPAFFRDQAFYTEDDIMDVAEGIYTVMSECAENAKMTVRSGANARLMKEQIAAMLVDNFVHMHPSYGRMAISVVNDAGEEVLISDDEGGEDGDAE